MLAHEFYLIHTHTWVVWCVSYFFFFLIWQNYLYFKGLLTEDRCSSDFIWNINSEIALSYVNTIFLTKWNILRFKNTLWFQKLHYTQQVSGDVDGKEKQGRREVWERWVWNSETTPELIDERSGHWVGIGNSYFWLTHPGDVIPVSTQLRPRGHLPGLCWNCSNEESESANAFQHISYQLYFPESTTNRTRHHRTLARRCGVKGESCWCKCSELWVHYMIYECTYVWKGRWQFLRTATCLKIQQMQKIYVDELGRIYVSALFEFQNGNESSQNTCSL